MWIGSRLRKALGGFSRKNSKLGKMVYIESPAETLEEVKKIVFLMSPYFDFVRIDKVFNDIFNLFSGHYPGYRQCNTRYHDFNHTTDCLLALARLMHGGYVQGIAFSRRDLELGLMSALMHDTGYIQSVDDTTGTGAKYTLSHIERSIEFMAVYFKDQGYPLEDLPACRNFLRCTGLDVNIQEIPFQTREHALIGKMLGTADLIGQMSDKNYLEKLPFLYQEFKEGRVPGFEDEFDLFRNTPHFWEEVKTRFATELGHVDGCLRPHFRVRWGIDQDLYQKAIDRNLLYLRAILANLEVDYPACPVRRELPDLTFSKAFSPRF